jgi:hypothetical protein
MQIAYCPFCGAEITVEGYEYPNYNIAWSRCRTQFCRGEREQVITDSGGWIIEPIDKRDYYIFSRPMRRKER